MSRDWHANIEDEHRQLALDGHNSDRDTPHWSENPSYPYNKRYGIDITALRDANWLPSHIVIVDDADPELSPPEALRFADSLAVVANTISLFRVSPETAGQYRQSGSWLGPVNGFK